MKEKKKIPTRVLDGASLPYYASEGAAGADVRAHIENEIVIEPGATALIPTGLFFEIPDGYEIQVRPRSGLALKFGITVLNTPGTIDSDYRGELKVILINHGKEPFVVEKEMRIGQIVVSEVVLGDFLVVEKLGATERSVLGFGHTGLR